MIKYCEWCHKDEATRVVVLQDHEWNICERCFRQGMNLFRKVVPVTRELLTGLVEDWESLGITETLWKDAYTYTDGTLIAPPSEFQGTEEIRFFDLNSDGEVWSVYVTAMIGGDGTYYVCYNEVH